MAADLTAEQIEADHGARINRCRGCDAPIIFVGSRGRRGKAIACNAASVDVGEHDYFAGKHERHSGTCPKPFWRRR